MNIQIADDSSLPLGERVELVRRGERWVAKRRSQGLVCYTENQMLPKPSQALRSIKRPPGVWHIMAARHIANAHCLTVCGDSIPDQYAEGHYVSITNVNGLWRIHPFLNHRVCKRCFNC